MPILQWSAGISFFIWNRTKLFCHDILLSVPVPLTNSWNKKTKHVCWIEALVYQQWSKNMDFYICDTIEKSLCTKRNHLAEDLIKIKSDLHHKHNLLKGAQMQIFKSCFFVNDSAIVKIILFKGNYGLDCRSMLGFNLWQFWWFEWFRPSVMAACRSKQKSALV